jgi:hypothetical protein
MLLVAALIYSSQFLAQCGPTVAPATTRAIIQVESDGNHLAIGDNQQRKSFAPRTREEAVALAAFLIRQGHSVDLGLMQISSAHLEPMRLSLEQVSIPAQTCGPEPRSWPISTGSTRRTNRHNPFSEPFPPTTPAGPGGVPAT